MWIIEFVDKKSANNEGRLYMQVYVIDVPKLDGLIFVFLILTSSFLINSPLPSD